MALQQTVSNSFIITFEGILSFAGSPPAGVVGQPYSYQFPTPTGGNAPYSFAFTTGQTNPVGWTLSTNGLLAGTPNATSLTFFITVVDTPLA